MWFYTPVDSLWEGSACFLPIEVNRKVLTHHYCNWFLKKKIGFPAAAKRPRDVKWSPALVYLIKTMNLTMQCAGETVDA